MTPVAGCAATLSATSTQCLAVNKFFHTILEDGKKYKDASYAEKIKFASTDSYRGRAAC